METYKHSCPRCGQHIEYTVEYCGTQMQCPMCGQTVTFPAIPPASAGRSVKAKTIKSKLAQQSPGKVPAVFGFLRNFQHWNTVWQCAVPFLIIAGLLAAAIVVKNKLGEPSSGDAAPILQADPEAMQKMTDLLKAEQTLQAAVNALNQANALNDYEEQARRHVDNTDPQKRKAADDQVQRAQEVIKAARRQFDAADAKYHQLGGAKNYRSELKKY